MIDIKTLNEFLGILENQANNNVSMFKSFMQVCNLVDFMLTELWERGEIGDNEKLKLRIDLNTAREKMIALHKKSMKETLKVSQVKDVDALIDFIYNSIF